MWLTVAADCALCIGGLSAAFLLYDVLWRNRHLMPVMKWVWPVTALYLGPAAILAYRKFQLDPMRAAMSSRHDSGPGAMRRPGPRTHVSCSLAGSACCRRDLSWDSTGRGVHAGSAPPSAS